MTTIGSPVSAAPSGLADPGAAQGVTNGSGTGVFDAFGTGVSNWATQGDAQRDMMIRGQDQEFSMQNSSAELAQWRTQMGMTTERDVALSTMEGHRELQGGMLNTTSVVDSAGAVLADKLKDVDPEDTDTINALMGNIRALPQANSMGMQNMTTMFSQGHGQVQSALGGTTNMNGAEMGMAVQDNPMAAMAAVSGGGMGMGMMGMPGMGMPMMDPTMGGMFGGAMPGGMPGMPGMPGAATGGSSSGGVTAGGFGG